MNKPIKVMSIHHIIFHSSKHKSSFFQTALNSIGKSAKLIKRQASTHYS